MSERRIPPAAEGLRHYLELETVNWSDMQPGSEVIVEALDMAKQQRGSFSFTVFNLEDERNGLKTVHVELKENDFTFVRSANREPVKLPPGTILKNGVACKHFPETNAFMSFLGGISVGRDYSFDEVMIPGGEILGTVLIPQVEALHTFMPGGEYTPPASFDAYKQRVAETKDKDQQEYDESVRLMDQQISESLPEFFDDEAVRQEILAHFATFDPGARYKLAVLLEYSQEDGVLDRYLDVLKHAIEEEFIMAPPGQRGISFLPASGRGFDLMVRELGLRVPRPPKQ